MKKNSITVYWSPTHFAPRDIPIDFFAPEPESITSKFLKNSYQNSEMRSCPAVKDMMKNVFSLNATVPEKFSINSSALQAADLVEKTGEGVQLPVNSKAPLAVTKRSSIPGYTNILYDISWAFFASEPVVARFSAPFFPHSEPVKGSIFSSGQFDVGAWYRPVSLDYHIPTKECEFEIKEEQELAYVEFFTDKKIVFKRYAMTQKLDSFLTSFGSAPSLTGQNKSLKDRYYLARKTKVLEIVKKEILNNLLD